MPRYSVGEQQRAALIVISYFHSWTLRKINADEHVKHASNLRQSHQTWQEALECWLDGNVLCQEAKRYIGNFMLVGDPLIAPKVVGIAGFSFSSMDKLKVPDHLEEGEYLQSWRWDCEQSLQIWQQLADIRLVKQSEEEVLV